jgi:hypothetical protein
VLRGPAFAVLRVPRKFAPEVVIVGFAESVTVEMPLPFNLSCLPTVICSALTLHSDRWIIGRIRIQNEAEKESLIFAAIPTVTAMFTVFLVKDATHSSVEKVRKQ